MARMTRRSLGGQAPQPSLQLPSRVSRRKSDIHARSIAKEGVIEREDPREEPIIGCGTWREDSSDSELSDAPSDMDTSPPIDVTAAAFARHSLKLQSDDAKDKSWKEPASSNAYISLHGDGSERSKKRQRISPGRSEDSAVSVSSPKLPDRCRISGPDKACQTNDVGALSPDSREPTMQSINGQDPEEATTRTYEQRLQARIAAFNCQQQRLCQDERVKKLNERFKRSVTGLPGTYYALMGEGGSYIIEKGVAVQSHVNPKDADILVYNNAECRRWLENGSGDKLVLLRDRTALNDRPYVTSRSMLEDIYQQDPETMVDTQDLGQKHSIDVAVRRMSIKEVLRRMELTSDQDAPVNCLDIACKLDMTPAPLKQYCDELTLAAMSVDTLANRNLKDRINSVGKKKTESKHIHAIDIDQCLKFQINGQAGAFSSWHMDNMGVCTFVTLEPNDETTHPRLDWRMREAEDAEAAKYDQFYWTANDEEVLKLWAFVRLDHLSEEEQELQLVAFKENGLMWSPPPELIKIIALIRGDTLIMPPGTIHAPITVTNCLFRGGMVMQRRQLARTFKFWRYLSDNLYCTNEDKPKETRAVLDYFQNRVHQDPVACGFHTPAHLAQFDRDCAIISGASLSCKCKGDCKMAKCSCMRYGQRCGPACHIATAGHCVNEYGCEATAAANRELVFGARGVSSAASPVPGEALGVKMEMGTATLAGQTV